MLKVEEEEEEEEEYEEELDDVFMAISFAARRSIFDFRTGGVGFLVLSKLEEGQLLLLLSCSPPSFV